MGENIEAAVKRRHEAGEAYRRVAISPNWRKQIAKVASEVAAANAELRRLTTTNREK